MARGRIYNSQRRGCFLIFCCCNFSKVGPFSETFFKFYEKYKKKFPLLFICFSNHFSVFSSISLFFPLFPFSSSFPSFTFCLLLFPSIPYVSSSPLPTDPLIPYFTIFTPLFRLFPLLFFPLFFSLFLLFQSFSIFFILFQSFSIFFNLFQSFSIFFNLFQSFLIFFNLFQSFSPSFFRFPLFFPHPLCPLSVVYIPLLRSSTKILTETLLCVGMSSSSLSSSVFFLVFSSATARFT